MQYTITRHYSTPECQDVIETAVYKRRDHAAYAYERMMYRGLSMNALLDRPVAQRAMAYASNAYDPCQTSLNYALGEQRVRFKVTR